MKFHKYKYFGLLTLIINIDEIEGELCEFFCYRWNVGTSAERFLSIVDSAVWLCQVLL